MPDLNTDLAAFIEKAEAATQGAWRLATSKSVKVERKTICRTHDTKWRHGDDEQETADAAHIAQCSPSVAIALARVAMAASTLMATPPELSLDEQDEECDALDESLAALSVALEENR